MGCLDLSVMNEKDYEYRYYYNFLALLTIIIGTNEFILKETKIPLQYVKRKGQIAEDHNGIIFVGSDSGGHFHFRRKGGDIEDSYKNGWQMKGTNGFCQTFAIMGYCGKTDNFKEGDYTHNAIVVLRFIKTKAKAIAKYWKNTVINNYDNIAFDYEKLNATEIKEDIDCVIKNEVFLRGWLSNETTFN